MVLVLLQGTDFCTLHNMCNFIQLFDAIPITENSIIDYHLIYFKYTLIEFAYRLHASITLGCRPLYPIALLRT